MYDVKTIIEGLSEKHSNAIAIFGSAVFAYDATFGSRQDMNKFMSYLPDVASRARFFEWHEGVAGALRRFCHICLVDPMLIEVYLGMSFEEATSL